MSDMNIALNLCIQKEDKVQNVGTKWNDLFNIFDSCTVYYSWTWFVNTCRYLRHKLSQKSSTLVKRFDGVEEILAVEWANGYVRKLQLQGLNNVSTDPGSNNNFNWSF